MHFLQNIYKQVLVPFNAAFTMYLDRFAIFRIYVFQVLINDGIISRTPPTLWNDFLESIEIYLYFHNRLLYEINSRTKVISV